MDSRLSRRATHRRYLRAGPWIFPALGLLLGVGVLVQACSDNNGRVTPTFPAGQTEQLALLGPPTISCGQTIQFIGTGGFPPYTFKASAGAIDASGKYTAPGIAGSDVVFIIDSTGVKASTTVTIECSATEPVPVAAP
jgi:hypothetical protein